MADEDARPLTEDERAELEELRAEKARREEVERARRERAELEALRAGRRAASEPAPAPASTVPVSPTPVQAPAAPAQPGPSAAPAPKSAPAPSPSVPGERTFGQRMVLSDGEDEDGIPTMPPAQKITIGVCFALAFVVIAYFVASNLGLLG